MVPTAVSLSLTLTLFLFGTGSLAASDPFHDPAAVLINVTQGDLNEILRQAFRGELGQGVEGREERPGRGVSGLVYRADLSDPRLELSEGGRASLSLSILEADIKIEHLKRRIADCENLGIVVDPERPVDLELQFSFSVSDGDLGIHPESALLRNSRKGFRLVKPSRCSNTLLPRWLLWWLGKPFIRRYIDRLDGMLLDEAQRSATEFAAEQGLMRKQWSKPSAGGDRVEELHLYPSHLDTSQGSLLLGFTGSTSDQEDPGAPFPAGGLPFPTSSFFAISEKFANRLLAFSMPNDNRKTGGHLATLLRKSSAYALMPGLREVARDSVEFSVRFRDAPTVRFERAPGTENRAMLRIVFSGVELEIRQTDAIGSRRLGLIEVHSGRLSIIPVRSVIGGVSFELVENDWVVSADGIEVNESLLAAALQEIVFSKIFETRQDPLGRGATSIGGADFQPRYFSVVGPYLVVETGGLFQANR